MILLFLFNNLLTIIYSLGAGVSLIYWVLKKKKITLIYFFLFFLYLLDNTFTYVGELLNKYLNLYNTQVYSIPFLKLLIYIGINFSLIKIILYLVNQEIRKPQWIILICNILLIMLTKKIDNLNLSEWLLYLPNQLILIYLAFYILKKRKFASSIYSPYLYPLAILFLLNAVGTLSEDTVTIFGNFMDDKDSIYKVHRSFVENFFSILYSAIFIKFILKDVSLKKDKNIDRSRDTEVININKVDTLEFLTSREKEIVVLLLQRNTNQEIADKLFLSIGTVKSHIHNIFIKLGVSRRQDVITFYIDYIGNNE